MMVRGPGLAESMSRYLIDRIAAAPNIELMTETEIIALSGSPVGGIEAVRWRDRRAGKEAEAPARNVFCSSAQIPPLSGCKAAWRWTRRAS